MGLSVAGDPAKIKPELESALALSDRLQHPMSALFVQGIMSPISSRNNVPPLHCSNLPMRCVAAPVKAPF